MKEQLQELLATIEENESRGIKLTKLARLWVLWNAKEISSDEFAIRVDTIIKKEATAAWQDFCKGRPTIAQGEDPLASLFF